MQHTFVVFGMMYRKQNPHRYVAVSRHLQDRTMPSTLLPMGSFVGSTVRLLPFATVCYRLIASSPGIVISKRCGSFSSLSSEPLTMCVVLSAR